ncbi:hypothetical protein ACFSTA_06425 [Ornithinibacillus salinisoli]|uniref:DUF3993 domain-containing protein n=1 Tax=Ornithinibacillus salinisoli TaxID=1848459 RepID=A0ABW4VY87_9BACI
MLRKSIILLVVSVLLYSLYHLHDRKLLAASNYLEGKNHVFIYGDIQNKVTMYPIELSHDEIYHIMNSFMNMLVQETDEDYKVVHFGSKEELLKEFEKLSSRDVAAQFVDYYYYEEADNLYLVPTETPPWFMEKNEYDIVKSDQKQVKIVQGNHSVFFGDYTIEITFSNINSNWKITDIAYPT